MSDDYYCDFILNGKVPVHVVAETDRVLAFHQGFMDSNYKVITNGGSYQSNQHLHIHIVSGTPLNPEHPAAKGELAV